MTNASSLMRYRISLIIPTLNAEPYIAKLINIILAQTIVPDEIIIIDSESDDRTIEICKEYDGIKIVNIKRNEFDHGGTRNRAITETSGDLILMLSQDVTPLHNNYIEKLIQPLLEDEHIVACSGRQIAYENASLREKLIRQFNYKDYSFVRDKNDLKELGYKTYYLSDCCSAYKRKAIEEVKMYEEPTLAIEDVLLVAKLINAGYKIAYAAEAEVLHSHDYLLKKQYQRNFDIGADIKINEDLLGHVKAEGEGIRMAKYVLKELLKKGHIGMALYFCVDCAMRLKAHRDGQNYEKYSEKALMKRTLNKNYWRKIGYVHDN